jgi:hypothetical protein
MIYFVYQVQKGQYMFSIYYLSFVFIDILLGNMFMCLICYDAYGIFTQTGKWKASPREKKINKKELKVSAKWSSLNLIF